MIASPSSAWRRASIRVAFSSSAPASTMLDSGATTGASGSGASDASAGAWGSSSANDDRLPLGGVPPLGRLVLDALLQHHDALDECLRARRATRHVHVDRDDLIDALGDRVRIPVGAAAVRARAHRDDVL